MTDADTTIDWGAQISLIQRRFEAALRAGDTVEGLDTWLQLVPESVRPQLRDQLQRCRSEISAASVETRVLSSDAALGQVTDNSHLFSLDQLTSADAVQECHTFAGLSPDAAVALQSRFEPRSFACGSKLLLQGEQARGLHLILSGSVDIIDTGTGERIDCDGAGSVLGEMSLLTEQPCSAEVVATSDVEALVLPTDGYRQLIAEHPELEIALSQLVSDRLGGRKHDALCGKTIGNYQLLRCINRGGMGVVYEARRVADGTPVAVKMLRHRFIYDDQMQGRFDQEAELLEGLRHPNIVSFRDHFLAFRTRFIVLDLCDGCDLYRLLHHHGPFDEPTVRAILGQIAEGLLYAHQAGIVHRDLKPGNVLVDRSGQIRLTDFGLSKLIESEVPEGKAVGTPAYMPPEQFRSDEVGPEVDWYALGCLACELLTGEILFQGCNWNTMYAAKRKRQVDQHWPPIHVSESLRTIIGGALSPSRHERWLDLEQMRAWADQTLVQAVVQ